MSEGDIILQEGTCSSNLGKIKYLILIPQNPQADQKNLDPITEDAEFEVVEPKMLEQQIGELSIYRTDIEPGKFPGL